MKHSIVTTDGKNKQNLQSKWLKFKGNRFPDTKYSANLRFLVTLINTCLNCCVQIDVVSFICADIEQKTQGSSDLKLANLRGEVFVGVMGSQAEKSTQRWALDRTNIMCYNPVHSGSTTLSWLVQ